jgi:hypothetical protein
MQLVIRWSPPPRPFRSFRPVRSLRSFRSFRVGWPFAALRVRSPFERVHCMFFGHDSVLDVEKRSLALRCRRCTWRSAGWQLDAPGKQPYQERAAPPTSSLTPSLCGPPSTR